MDAGDPFATRRRETSAGASGSSGDDSGDSGSSRERQRSAKLAQHKAHKGHKRSSGKRRRREAEKFKSSKRKKKKSSKKERWRDPEQKALDKLADAFRYTKSGDAEKLARVLSRLIGIGVSPDEPDAHGWTCLHHACNLNDSAAAFSLLSAGADASLKDPLGNTPAHLVARHCNMELLEELLYAAKPADMEAKNSQGYTPRLIMLEALAVRRDRQAAALAAAEARRKAREEEEWRTRLSEAAQDDFVTSGAWMGEDDGWGYEDPGEPALPGGMGDEEYRSHIVREMAKRRAQSHCSAQPGPQASSASEKRKRRMEDNEQKNKHWRDVLEEEVKKDRAWREGVLQGRSNAVLRDDYEKRWQAFLLRERPAGAISHADVPWVATSGTWREHVPGVVLCGLAAGDSTARKKRLRMELMRWHPDKFRARFHQCLAPADSERIMQDVTELSAVLTGLNSQVT